MKQPMKQQIGQISKQPIEQSIIKQSNKHPINQQNNQSNQIIGQSSKQPIKQQNEQLIERSTN